LSDLLHHSPVHSGSAAPPLPANHSMPDLLTLEDFEPRLGELFRIVVDDKLELRTRLAEVTRWSDRSASGGNRHPFSLVFLAAPGSFIPQQIYLIENEHMEPFDCFITPINPDARGTLFEAVFT
jgi:hypothetical protein